MTVDPPTRLALPSSKSGSAVDEILLGAGAAGLTAIASRSGHAQTPSSPPADHTIRIAPVSLEIAPGKIIKTTGYNGTVPGPVLRLREGTAGGNRRHQ